MTDSAFPFVKASWSGPRETVLLLHGTFASPQAAKIQWHTPGSEFCQALDRELERLGSSARCWAHLGEKRADPNALYFHWDGKNSRPSRLESGAELRAHLTELDEAGWKVHVVAHSHGGNVLLEATGEMRRRALDWDYHDYLQPTDPWILGRLVLLGTPVIDVERSGPGAAARRRTLLVALSAAVWVLLLALLWKPLVESGAVDGRLLWLPALFWLPGLLARLIWVPTRGYLTRSFKALNRGRIWVTRLFQGKLKLMAYLEDDEHRRTKLPILLLTSRKDEAYNLLAKVWNAANPWQGEAGAAKAPLSERAVRPALDYDDFAFRGGGTLLALAATLAGVAGLGYGLHRFGGELLEPAPSIGVGMLLSALFAVGLGLFFRSGPLGRVVALPARALTVATVGAFHAFDGTRRLLRKAWKILQALTIGLADSSLPRSAVRVSQEVPTAHFELLDPETEHRTEAQLDDSASALPTALLDLLQAEGDEVTAESLDAALGAIVTDLQLIHSSYYQNPTPIGRIAEFIAGKWQPLSEAEPPTTPE